MGKASILLVAGYSILALIMGVNNTDIATQAVDNSLAYYESSMVRNIAIAGANMAANHLFLNPPFQNGNPWWDGFGSPIDFDGGYFVVSVDSSSSIDPFSGEPRLTLRSEGHLRDSVHTVTLVMRPSSFAKFAVYAGPSGAMNAYWETGDSALGPVHSEGVLKTHGTPYFGGKTTARNGVDSTSWSGHPIFSAGIESGISIPMNKSYRRLDHAAQSGGKYFGGPSGNDLTLVFKGDSVTWRRGMDPDTTSYLPTFAPNGTIVLGKGNVHVSGIVKGRYTVGALDSTGVGRGRIVIDDDIQYQNDPVANPTSTDMLGLVAYRDVNIDGDKHKSTFRVDASMFAYKEGVTVTQYNSRDPGMFYTRGGWIVENVYPTSNGIPLGNAGSKGYKCKITFDERFRIFSPPYFPTTGMYEILAWHE